MNLQQRGAKQTEQTVRQLGNTMKQRTQNRRQKLQPQQQLKLDKSTVVNTKTKLVELSNSQQSQEKLKRTRKFSQTEIPKCKQPVNNSSVSVISFDDLPLAMSASASPEPPFHQRRSSRNKNIVLLYDEDDKTSKEVSAHLGIALPVLAKYELTTDTIQKHEEDQRQESGDHGSHPDGDTPEEDSEKTVSTITPRLLQEHDENQNEVQNKGLHVIQWLSDLNNQEIESHSLDPSSERKT